jgi:hypothetical protein
MYYKSWDMQAWSPSQTGWEDLGGPVAADPSVASSAPDRVHVLTRSPQGVVLHRTWTRGIGWVPAPGTPWETVGRNASSEPVAISSQPGSIDVFVTSSGGELCYRRWDASGGWQPPPTEQWVTIGDEVFEAPGVVSWGPKRMDVFIRKLDGGMYHKWWDDAPDRFDVFVATDLEAPPPHHLWWPPGVGWLPSPADEWEHLGGQLSSPPAVVAWGRFHHDVFARGVNGHLYHKWWDPETGWLPSITDPWEYMGGVLASAPTAIAPALEDCLAVFVRGPDNTINCKYRDPGVNWRPSTTRWYTLGEEVPGRFTGSPCAVMIDIRRIAVLTPGVDGDLYWTLDSLDS